MVPVLHIVRGSVTENLQYVAENFHTVAETLHTVPARVATGCLSVGSRWRPARR